MTLEEMKVDSGAQILLQCSNERGGSWTCGIHVILAHF